MSDQSTEIIVAEVRDLRSRMGEQFDSQDKEITAQGKQIAELAVRMKDLVGKGKPGRFQQLESDVKGRQRYKTTVSTVITLAGGVLSALIHQRTRHPALAGKV